jgi:hypothetical protein
MHPVFTEFIVAERTKEQHAQAAAARRARQFRRSRRTWLFTRVPQGSRSRVLHARQPEICV